MGRARDSREITDLLSFYWLIAAGAKRRFRSGCPVSKNSQPVVSEVVRNACTTALARARATLIEFLVPTYEANELHPAAHRSRWLVIPCAASTPPPLNEVEPCKLGSFNSWLGLVFRVF